MGLQNGHFLQGGLGFGSGEWLFSHDAQQVHFALPAGSCTGPFPIHWHGHGSITAIMRNQRNTAYSLDDVVVTILIVDLAGQQPGNSARSVQS